MVDTPLLRVRDLVTSFRTDRGTLRAVDQVSFEVPRATTVALVGESGCGKSVTALSILRLVASPPGRIESGAVELEGRDLLGLPEREMRAVRGNVASMIFQEPMTSLNPVYAVGWQIMEAIRLHQKKSRREARTRTVELLRLVGLPEPDTQVDSYPHHLSGGQRQRVMIAMALACEPKLLIADEPTTALDVTIQAQILELLRELQQRLGMSILLITHDLGIVAENARYVVVMYAGRVGGERAREGALRAAHAPLHARPPRERARREAHRQPAPADHRGDGARSEGARRGLPLRRALPAAHRKVHARGAAPRGGGARTASRDAGARWTSSARGRVVSGSKDLFQPATTAPPTREESVDPEGGAPGSRPRTLVATERVAKYFPVRAGWLGRGGRFLRAVDGVSLRVRRGETMGLVGESGCGKSTLGRLMLRLLDPTFGRIVFDGGRTSPAARSGASARCAAGCRSSSRTPTRA